MTPSERLQGALRELTEAVRMTDMGIATVEAACDAAADLECAPPLLDYPRKCAMLEYGHEDCRARWREAVGL